MASVKAIDMSELGREVTMSIEVTGIRRFNLRTSLGVALIRLGARVLPVTVCMAVEGPTLRRDAVETGTVDGWANHRPGPVEGWKPQKSAAFEG